MNTVVSSNSVERAVVNSINTESIAKSGMRMNKFADAIKSMGFVSVYRDEFSMVNGHEGIEMIACHPDTGVIIYATSISGRVSTARFYYETGELSMNFDNTPMDEFKISEVKFATVCHASCYMWTDFMPQYKMILENGNPHMPWRHINKDFFQWYTERDLQFDACDTAIYGPFHLIDTKIKLSAAPLKKVLGIKG